MFQGSITAMITPFKGEEKELDIEAFRSLVREQKVSDGVVIGGTTGEGPTCQEEEIERLTEVALEEVGGEVSVLVATGTNDTRKSIERTKRAKEMGADGALVVLPYYNKPTERGVLLHFEAVARIGLPLIVYYSPGRSGVTLSPETLVKLTKIDSIVGIKETSGDLSLCKAVLHENPEAVLLTGNDDNLIEFMKLGGKGSLNVLNNLVPGEWKRVVDLLRAGDFAQATLLYNELIPFIQAIYREVNPQGIKAALSLLGKCENTLRLPLVPVSTGVEEELKSLLCRKFS